MSVDRPPPGSADGRTGTTTRRRLLLMAGTVAAFAPLAAPSAKGTHWVNLDLRFASIAPAAGPVTAHLSDNDPFTAHWRSLLPTGWASLARRCTSRTALDTT
jgi:hypothetical protein